MAEQPQLTTTARYAAHGVPGGPVSGRYARSLRALIGRPVSVPGVPVDEIAGHFARRYAGVPATSRGGGEPVRCYPTGSGVGVLVGPYGDEERIRSWLPGLPERADPASVAALLAAARAPRRTTTPVCRQIVDPVVDLTALPIARATPRDAGAYLTAGVIHARDPETGEVALSAHRMLRTGKDRLGVWMVPGRGLRAMHERALAAGRTLPVSVNIGVPPAAMLASALGSRFLPPGVGKLHVAGALAGAPVRLAAALTQPTDVLADSEIVLEGYLGGGHVPEGDNGTSLPEFLGYDGHAQDVLAELVVTAVTRRRGAMLQTIVGPGREQSYILGLAGALSAALSVAPDAASPVVHDIRLPPAGGGMLLLVLSVRKGCTGDDALPRRIADGLLRAHPFVKQVVAVDHDVDPGSAEDVLWAMTTRCNLGLDVHTEGGFKPLLMDPSQTPEWADGGPLRTFVDATVPYHLRGLATRSYAGFPVAAAATPSAR